MKYLTGMVVGEKGTPRNRSSLFHYNFFAELFMHA